MLRGRAGFDRGVKPLGATSGQGFNSPLLQILFKEKIMKLRRFITLTSGLPDDTEIFQEVPDRESDIGSHFSEPLDSIEIVNTISDKKTHTRIVIPMPDI